jgi:flagellar basal-body rod protein FlgB
MGAAMEGANVVRTDELHMNAQGGTGAGGGPAPLVDALGAPPSLDGNMVDLDRTMAQLAENAMQYNAGAKAASKKLAMLRYVASDGNG